MRMRGRMLVIGMFAAIGCVKETADLPGSTAGDARDAQRGVAGSAEAVLDAGAPDVAPKPRKPTTPSPAPQPSEPEPMARDAGVAPLAGGPCNGGGTLVRKGSGYVCDCTAAPQGGPFCDGNFGGDDAGVESELALSITADSYYSCALTASRGVRCWGDAEFGTLGNGSYTDSERPVAVKDLAGVRQLEAGLLHGCAVIDDGSLHCWGSNDLEELRDGSNNRRNIPVTAQIAGDVVQVSLGESQSCVRRADSSLECWGLHSENLAPPGTSNVVDIEAGYFITTAWFADGSVRSWGEHMPPPIPAGAKIKRVASGYGFVCALTDAGKVYCGGWNHEGQLGTGSSATEGDGAVADISNAVAIAAGFEHACALLDDGMVRCWGQNNRGQLGDGSFDDRPTPSAVVDLQHVAEVVCGREHCCARKEAGQLYCWGQNAHGQLGDGTKNDSATPVAVLGF